MIVVLQRLAYVYIAVTASLRHRGSTMRLSGQLAADLRRPADVRLPAYVTTRPKHELNSGAPMLVYHSKGRFLLSSSTSAPPISQERSPDSPPTIGGSFHSTERGQELRRTKPNPNNPLAAIGLLLWSLSLFLRTTLQRCSRLVPVRGGVATESPAGEAGTGIETVEPTLTSAGEWEQERHGIQGRRIEAEPTAESDRARKVTTAAEWFRRVRKSVQSIERRPSSHFSTLPRLFAGNRSRGKAIPGTELSRTSSIVS